MKYWISQLEVALDALVIESTKPASVVTIFCTQMDCIEHTLSLAYPNGLWVSTTLANGPSARLL
jgi:hypothetical protein